MPARQGLSEIAVALVGYDDARTGLADAEVGAGEPDISIEEPRAQHRTPLVTRLPRRGQQPIRVERAMLGPECLRNLLLNQMDCRRDDMAGRLVPQLDDVFAEIGLDRGDVVRLEEIIEPDLLSDH